MAKRELIYKDEARRAVLKNAAGVAWCIDSVKPVMVVDDTPTKPVPQIDEYWIARVQYWPGDTVDIDIILIHYPWKDGTIEFIPFGSLDGDVVNSNQCAQFELLERIGLEKYK